MSSHCFTLWSPWDSSMKCNTTSSPGNEAHGGTSRSMHSPDNPQAPSAGRVRLALILTCWPFAQTLQWAPLGRAVGTFALLFTMDSPNWKTPYDLLDSPWLDQAEPINTLLITRCCFIFDSKNSPSQSCYLHQQLEGQAFFMNTKDSFYVGRRNPKQEWGNGLPRVGPGRVLWTRAHLWPWHQEGPGLPLQDVAILVDTGVFCKMCQVSTILGSSFQSCHGS